MSEHKQSSGWGIPADTIALLLTGIGVVASAYWFVSQPSSSQARLIEMGIYVLTLLLPQPGVFLTLKILRSELPLKKKRIFVALSVGLATFAIPLGITACLFYFFT